MYTLTTFNSFGNPMGSGTVAGSTFTVQSITAATVVAQSTVAGDTGLVDVSIPTTVDILVGGRIQILFPTGYNVAATAITNPSGINAASTITSVGPLVTITIVGATASSGTLAFRINGVTNPGTGQHGIIASNTCLAAGQPGSYTYSILNSVGVVMESGTSGVALTSNDPLSGVAVTPASTTAGATSINAAVTLTTSVNIPIGGHIQVTFPMGFYVASNTLSSPVGINEASTVSSSGRVVTITIAGAAAVPGSISFTINGITNPGNEDDFLVT